VQHVKTLFNQPRRLVVAIVAVWVACSLAYALLEGEHPVQGLWWGVVTGSTVGYGDYYPSSVAGQVVAMLLIVAMLVMVPIAIGHVIAGFVVDRNAFTHDEQVALARSVSDLHERVALVERLVLASLQEQHGHDWVAQRIEEHRLADESQFDPHEQMLQLFGGDPGR